MKTLLMSLLRAAAIAMAGIGWGGQLTRSLAGPFASWCRRRRAGGLDIMTRPVAPKMDERFPQAVVVGQRSGADTLLGTRLVKGAPADGYKILAQANGFTALPAMRPEPGDDSVNDFKRIGLMVRSPQMRLVGRRRPDRSAADGVACAKSSPGMLSYGSAGVGGPPHLGAALSFHRVGLGTVHIPYKGNGAALPDVADGLVNAIFGAYSGGAAYLRGGRLRAPRATGTKRLAALPDVPNLQERGVDLGAYFWLGLLTPAGTPNDVMVCLADALDYATHSRDDEEVNSAEWSEPMAASPDELQDYLGHEATQMTRPMRELRIVRE